MILYPFPLQVESESAQEKDASVDQVPLDPLNSCMDQTFDNPSFNEQGDQDLVSLDGTRDKLQESDEGDDESDDESDES